jgi:uncharacterized protein with HEPN domain
MRAAKKRDDRFLVEEMQRHLAVAISIAATGKGRVSDDIEARYALEHAVELFAEAAKKTSNSFREANSGIDWLAVRAFRRVLAHPYEADAEPTSVDQLWMFVRDAAPRIVRELKRAKYPRLAQST